MRDAGKAVITVMAELELVAPVVIAFLVATLNLEGPRGRVGGPHMRFSTRTAPQPQCSRNSLPVAFARSDMFKDVAVSECLMMTGKFAGPELGSCRKRSGRLWSFTSHSFAVEGVGPPDRLRPSIPCSKSIFRLRYR